LFGDIDNSQTSPYLNHGGENTGTDDNKTFYEFLFDLLDSLSQGKFAGKFGQSGINYKFSSSTYGPGPYISGENEANNDTTYNK
jgi:hypothetical protein